MKAKIDKIKRLATVDGIVRSIATVRKDLLEEQMGVPVGETHYSSSEPLPYRWTRKEEFKVFHNNKWQDAESIDFDFN